MSDPLDKATSKAPATLGEGCLSRYDPDDLDNEDGTDFPGAAELWAREQGKPAHGSDAEAADQLLEPPGLLLKVGTGTQG